MVSTIHIVQRGCDYRYDLAFDCTATVRCPETKTNRESCSGFRCFRGAIVDVGQP